MKILYLSLGFVFLALGILGILLPMIPSVPFLILTLFFFSKGSDRVHQWFITTTIYNKHLKPLKEQRGLSKKSKIQILALATLMMGIGFYFTPSLVGKSIILIVLIFKYWFFFFRLKTIEDTPR